MEIIYRVVLWTLVLCHFTRSKKDNCNNKLGMESRRIPDESITASSKKSSHHLPYFARIDDSNAWCSAPEDESPYIDILLDKQKLITAITTQGSSSDLSWARKYEVKYLEKGRWKPYKEELTGNQNSRSLNTNKLYPAIRTQNIRIYPKEPFSVFLDPTDPVPSCLRLELHGCSAPEQVHGGWSEWSKWSLCTKNISGIQTRSRECTNPKPEYGGNQCVGSKAALRECSTKEYCQEDFPLRLETQGMNPSLGTMEIYKNNTWNKLCTPNWNKDESILTCMAMGYFENSVYDNGTRYNDRNTSNATIRRNCSSLTNCMNTKKDEHQLCKVPVRLNGARSNYSGRVEVFYSGKWGRICPNKWDISDVHVICRQLGFKNAISEFTGSDVEDSRLPFLISEVNCTGDEFELASCVRTDGEVDCQDGLGAQALCEPLGDKEVLPKEKMVMDIGNKETFRCTLKNNTKLIRWYNSTGQELNSAPGGRIKTFRDGTFTIESVKLSDGGIYQCKGLKYTKYYTIYVNARFTNENSRQTLVVGKSGILNCSAEGNPAPRFKWTRTDGKALDNKRFIQLPNGNMYVNPVFPDDGGKHICIIEQNKGTTRTTGTPQYITVFIIVQPKVQLLGPNRTMREGDRLNLTCVVEPGSPKPQVSWYKNEILLVDEESMNLTLEEVSDKDEGLFKCEARNPAGVANGIINITIDVPPKANPALLWNQSVPLNSTFAMECYVKGDPPPKVNWSKDGSDLRIKENTLTIDSVTSKDAVSPQIFVSPRKQNVPEGNTAKFLCKATGFPNPTITWKFNDGNLPSPAIEKNTEEGYQLLLPNVTKDMNGTYKCIAEKKGEYNKLNFNSSYFRETHFQNYSKRVPHSIATSRRSTQTDLQSQ